MGSKALGRGLSALIPNKEEANDAGRTTEDIAYIKTDLIANNTNQPRSNYNTEKLDDLKASIKEKGILQPILVREKGAGYEVVAGERRLKAARALNLDEVPVIIKNITDQESLVIALIENIQREELNPIEEAVAYRKLMDEFQYTQDMVAQAVSKDRSTVSNLLRLLRLPEAIQKNVFDGAISAGHARALLALEQQSDQRAICAKVIKQGLSVRELESLINTYNKKDIKKDKIVEAKNPQLEEVQQGLRKILGTKVDIVSNKKRGKVIIDYYSSEDLTRIVKIMIK